MTSVERIMQYSDLEQEAPEHTDLKPPPNWPSRGAIQLRGMSLKYRHQEKPALGPISANILPAEKVMFIINSKIGSFKESVTQHRERMLRGGSF